MNYSVMDKNMFDKFPKEFESKWTLMQIPSRLSASFPPLAIEGDVQTDGQP